MHKKFDFRESFRDAVLLGFFREPFATCVLAFAKECEITVCTLFIIEVLEAAHVSLVKKQSWASTRTLEGQIQAAARPEASDIQNSSDAQSSHRYKSFRTSSRTGLTLEVHLLRLPHELHPY